MRPALLFSGALALLLAATPCLRAQDEPTTPDKPKAESGDKGEKGEPGAKAEEGEGLGKEKLPWNPFEKAAVGDWATFAGSVNAEGTPMPIHQQIAGYWKVVKVEGDTVTIKSGEKGMMGRPPVEKEHTFSKKEAPTLDQLFEMHDKKVKDFKSEDGKVTVEGREFSGKKYTFTTQNPMGGKMKSEMFLSPDAKGSGLVQMVGKMSQKAPNGQKIKITFDMHIAGFGTKDKTEWGKTYEELSKATGDDDADEGGKKDDGKKEDAPKKDADEGKKGDK